MLSIGDFRKPFGRREFLQVGGLGLGGLSLSQVLGTKAIAGTGNPLRRSPHLRRRLRCNQGTLQQVREFPESGGKSQSRVMSFLK